MSCRPVLLEAIPLSSSLSSSFSSSSVQNDPLRVRSTDYGCLARVVLVSHPSVESNLRQAGSGQNVFFQIVSDKNDHDVHHHQDRNHHHHSNNNSPLASLLDHWIRHPRDTTLEMKQSIHKLRVMTSRTGGNDVMLLGRRPDVIWWSHVDGKPPLRHLTKLRRILAPILLHTVVEMDRSDSCNSSSSSSSSSSTITSPSHSHFLEVLDVSMADLWLQSPLLRQKALGCFLQYASLLRQWTNRFRGLTECHYMYHRLTNRLLQVIRQTNEQVVFRGKQLDLSQLDANDLLPLPGCHQVNRRSYAVNTRLELLDIRCKRRTMHAEFVDAASQVEDHDESLLIAEQEHGMTERQFLEEAYFMNKVNRSIARTFDPLLSRPRMARIRITPNHVQQLKNILFATDGSLNPAIIPDVTTSEKHNYINFSNAYGAGSGDQRWQIQFKLHAAHARVPTRARLERLLAKAKVIDPKYEIIHDLGVLVGGTEDQSLHHDISRQWTFWLPSKADVGTIDPTLGWEDNRLVYNMALASQHAPCSMLLAMGEPDMMQIGVQKDQIERLTGNRCRIRYGSDTDIFNIVREDEYLVVLEVKTGCVLGADFPHAGVRNVKSNSPEDALLIELNQRIGHILEKYGDNDVEKTRRVLKMFCDFKGLNQLCRFHCSTELGDERMKIPRNMVGYTGCYPNRRGGFHG